MGGTKEGFQREKGWHALAPMDDQICDPHTFTESFSVSHPAGNRDSKITSGINILRDYTNVLHPQSGFHLDVFTELRKQTASLLDKERWVVLLHDEISIKQELVYDKVTGELVGFIDQSNWNDATAKESHLATHALVFMVVGITSNIKMSLGYVPTITATANQIMPWLWKAIGLLENVCNLKVGFLNVRPIFKNVTIKL